MNIKLSRLIKERRRKYDNKFNPRNKGEVLTYVYLLMS